jgi:ATP-dependent Clp protease ATP-binding subunit ClpB
LGNEADRRPGAAAESLRAATGDPDQIYVTPRLNKLLASAEDEAGKLKDEYISVEHVSAGGGRRERRRWAPAEGIGPHA